MIPNAARLFLTRAARPAALTAILSAAGCQSTAPNTSEYDSGTPAAIEAADAEQPTSNPNDDFVTVSEGIRIDHRGWADLGYRWEWTIRPFGRGNTEIDLVNPLGDHIAVQASDSFTTAVETSTGRTEWQVRNTSPLTSFVANARAGDTLISCARPEMYLMDINTGNLLARQPIHLVVTTPPVIDGGYAVFGTPVGQVLCHRFGDSKGNPLPPPLEEGLDIWGYSLDGAITAAPVRMGHTAGFVTERGHVFFVDILSGSSRGSARISGGMDTNPVTDGQYMYVASRDQSIYAFAPESSTYFWRERTADPITVQPTHHSGTLYCTLDAEGLVAYDVSQNALDAGEFGRRRWVNPDARGEVIAVQNRDLIVWNAPALLRVDVNTGDIIGSIELKGINRVITGNSLEDSDILAIGTKGQLVRFSAR